eukprot:12744443-Ditylum_brightwellii.AAC.1
MAQKARAKGGGRLYQSIGVQFLWLRLQWSSILFLLALLPAGDIPMICSMLSAICVLLLSSWASQTPRMHEAFEGARQ